MDGGHTHRVLRGDGRDGAGPEDAERVERLEVRLDARTAAAVAAGDGQGDGTGLGHGGSGSGAHGGRQGRKVEDRMPLSQRRAQLLARLRHRKTRVREELVLVEGVRAAGRPWPREPTSGSPACRRASTAPRAGRRRSSDSSRRRVDMDLLGDDEVADLADTEHPQGVLLVCREPRWRRSTRSAGAISSWTRSRTPETWARSIRAAVAFGLDAAFVLWTAPPIRGVRRPCAPRRGWSSGSRIHMLGVDGMPWTLHGEDGYGRFWSPPRRDADVRGICRPGEAGPWWWATRARACETSSGPQAAGGWRADAGARRVIERRRRRRDSPLRAHRFQWCVSKEEQSA